MAQKTNQSCCCIASSLAFCAFLFVIIIAAMLLRSVQKLTYFLLCSELSLPYVITSDVDTYTNEDDTQWKVFSTFYPSFKIKNGLKWRHFFEEIDAWKIDFWSISSGKFNVYCCGFHMECWKIVENVSLWQRSTFTIWKARTMQDVMAQFRPLNATYLVTCALLLQGMPLA